MIQATSFGISKSPTPSFGVDIGARGAVSFVTSGCYVVMSNPFYYSARKHLMLTMYIEKMSQAILNTRTHYLPLPYFISHAQFSADEIAKAGTALWPPPPIVRERPLTLPKHRLLFTLLLRCRRWLSRLHRILLH